MVRESYSTISLKLLSALVKSSWAECWKWKLKPMAGPLRDSLFVYCRHKRNGYLIQQYF